MLQLRKVRLELLALLPHRVELTLDAHEDVTIARWAALNEAEVFKKNPFASVDQTGVGQLMEIAITKGRKTRPDIKLGICGEHGGDPDSVKFCHKIGLSYVSCSPYRVPVARLAAAQAAVADAKK